MQSVKYAIMHICVVVPVNTLNTININMTQFVSKWNVGYAEFVNFQSKDANYATSASCSFDCKTWEIMFTASEFV